MGSGPIRRFFLVAIELAIGNAGRKGSEAGGHQLGIKLSDRACVRIGVIVELACLCSLAKASYLAALSAGELEPIFRSSLATCLAFACYCLCNSLMACARRRLLILVRSLKSSTKGALWRASSTDCDFMKCGGSLRWPSCHWNFVLYTRLSKTR